MGGLSVGTDPFQIGFSFCLGRCLCVTISFRALNWTSRETYDNWENNSIETTRLARMETRHDFLAHGVLLRASLYGLQGCDSVLFPL